MSRCKPVFLHTRPSYMKNIQILPHVRIVTLESVSENTSWDNGVSVSGPVLSPSLLSLLYHLPVYFSLSAGPLSIKN